ARVLLAAGDEHLFAVERDPEAVRVLENRFLLALVEIEVDDRALLVVYAGAWRPSVEQLALHRLQVRVAPRFRRQHDGARLEPIEIDVYGGRRRGRALPPLAPPLVASF